MKRIAPFAATLTALIVLVAAPAAASIPSGPGWSGSEYFSTPTSATFTLTEPGASLSGTATSSGGTVNVSVTVYRSSGPCVLGLVRDEPDSGPYVTVTSVTQCATGSVQTTGSRTPTGPFHVLLCGSSCNSIYVEMRLPMPTGSMARWAYSSATTLNFWLLVGGASFAGTTVDTSTGRQVSGTLTHPTPPGPCVSAQEMVSGLQVWACGPGATTPLSITIPTGYDTELDLGASGVDLLLIVAV
jgi:hypothetical protein